MLDQDFHQKLARDFVSVLFRAFFGAFAQAADCGFVCCQKVFNIRGIAAKIIPLEVDEKFL